MKRKGNSHRNRAGAMGARSAFLLKSSAEKREPVPATGVQLRKRAHRLESKAAPSPSGDGQKRWKVAAWILVILLAYLVLRVIINTAIDFYIDIAQVVNWEPPKRDA